MTHVADCKGDTAKDDARHCARVLAIRCEPAHEVASVRCARYPCAESLHSDEQDSKGLDGGAGVFGADGPVTPEKEVHHH
jgi:hypothetical protein